MKPLLLTIALLLSTPAWADEDNVDGNSFFCSPLQEHENHYALVFQEGEAILYDPAEWIKDKYFTSARWVSWYEDGKSFGINREALLLNIVEGVGDNTNTLQWQCELSSKRAAIKKVKKLRALKDSKAREGNKF